jgi:hypothetical protein
MAVADAHAKKRIPNRSIRLPCKVPPEAPDDFTQSSHRVSQPYFAGKEFLSRRPASC